MMEKTLSSKESLALITEMIGKAKKEAGGDGGFQLLLWGWVVAGCNFGHYALDKAGFDTPYLVWLAIVPAVLVSFWKSYQRRNQARVKTHLDEVLGQLWLVVFVGMVIVLSFMRVLDFNQNPIILILAGIGILTTGAMVKEPSLKMGGVVLFLGAIVGLLLPVSEQYLVAGIAMVAGYLVPGYLIKKKYGSRV